MATDATGTPTTLGIPKLDVSNDAPSGLGFNAAMDEIDTLIAARIELPSSPSDGDGLVYDAGLGKWVAASTVGAASVTPIQLLNPFDSSSFWTISAMTGGTVLGHWEYIANASGWVYGQVLVPAGVTDATLRFAIGANATSGVTRLALYANALADGAGYGGSTWANGNPLTAQDVLVPSTALTRKDVTFSVSGLSGGDILILSLFHDGTNANDTLAVNTLLFGAWLEPA